MLLPVTSTVQLEEPIPVAHKTRAETPETKVSNEAYNPYLAARREWDERYGHLISRERNWRLMAILSSLVALFSIGGMIRLSTKSHIVPFVVAMDSLGRTAAAGAAEETSPTDDRLKRATLFNWVLRPWSAGRDGRTVRAIAGGDFRRCPLQRPLFRLSGNTTRDRGNSAGRISNAISWGCRRSQKQRMPKDSAATHWLYTRDCFVCGTGSARNLK
jgi:hypothetical protein